MTRIDAATAVLLMALLAGAWGAHAAEPMPLDTRQTTSAADEPATVPFALMRDVVEHYKPDRLARLLDDSLSPNARDPMGRTLLHFAASKGRGDLVTLLLDRGADVNAVSDNGDAPLNWAVQAGKPEIVALLRSRGAQAHDALTAATVGDVDRLRDFLDADPSLIDRTYHFWPSSQGLSLLAMAAVYNQADVAALLIEKGADVHRSYGSDAVTPLYLAAQWNAPDALRLLLQYDKRVNQKLPWDWTPMRVAATRGHAEIVAMLREHGGEDDIFVAAALGDLPRVRELVEADPTRIHATMGYHQTPLAVAAWRGQGEVIRFLAERGADVNVRQGEHDVPLSTAAWKNDLETVRLLLDLGADIEIGAGEQAYGTPLHHAAYQGHADMIRLLLDRGAMIDSVDNTKDTPLLFAAQKNHIEAARLLLDRGANPDGSLTGNRSPIGAATREGLVDMVQLLIERGANVNQYENTGTPIHIAAQMGHVELVKMLLAHPDLRPLIRGHDGRMPLHFAVQCQDAQRPEDYRAIVELLVAHGHDLNTRSRRDETPLQTALRSTRDPGMADRLIALGADVNVRDRAGLTPLHTVCMYPRRPDPLATARLLLAHGADVNAADQSGRTPIHCAAAHADETSAAVAALLEASGAELDYFAMALLGRWDQALDMVQAAQLNARIGDRALLHVAAQQGNVVAAQQLIDRGANVSIEAQHGGTPLTWAVHARQQSMAAFLIEQGVEINAANPDRSALRAAAYAGDADMVRMLIHAGAIVHANNAKRSPALYAAALEGHAEICRVLLEAGANFDIKTFQEAVRYGRSETALLLIEHDRHGTLQSAYPQAMRDAAARGMLDVIGALFQRQAPINALDSRDQTPLDAAESNNQREAARLLRLYGAQRGHVVKELPPHKREPLRVF